MKTRNISLIAVIAMMGCVPLQHLKAPAQLSPAGDVAYYARHATSVVKELQTVAIDGEASGVIPTSDAKRIIEATLIAGNAGTELAKALKDGVLAKTAKERALVLFRDALTDVMPLLSVNTRKIVQPYVDAALTLLTVFG